MARHGTPIQTVAHILGHEKIDTTMEYVQQSAQDIKYDYRRLYA
jgi:site-specific recombinase XerD